MSLGKAQKQNRSKQIIIQAKLDAKLLTDDYYEDFKSILDTKVDSYYDKKKKVEMENKFNMYVYDHILLNSLKMTKSDWLEWIENIRK